MIFCYEFTASFFFLSIYLLHYMWNNPIPVCVRLCITILAYDGNDFLHIVQFLSGVDPSIGLGDRCDRFGGELFDIANSVSVCLFCTCRTHSAGVKKYMQHRSQRNEAILSEGGSC